MDYTGVFTYNMQNLLIEAQNPIIFLGMSIFFLFFLIFCRKIGILLLGMYMLYQDNKIINNKKKVLSDLILMKDIQTELEKEIEQATLKAAFQN